MIHFISNTIETADNFKLANIQDCLAYCAGRKVLGVDTETEGFDFTCKKMIMFQIGDNEKQFIIDTRTVDISPLKDILELYKQLL